VTATIEDGAAAKLPRLFFYKGLENLTIELSCYHQSLLKSGHMSDYKFEVRRSSIHGKGLFARSRIPARRKVGELGGEVISQAEARRRESFQVREPLLLAQCLYADCLRAA
jgi:hypothetical protein